MPTQSTDTENGILFGEDVETWTIKAGVSVASSGTSVYSNHGFSTLLNHGDVTGQAGVLMSGDYAFVTNAADGSIVATNNGVELGGLASDVVNFGLISARREGVVLSGEGDQLVNHGDVYGGEVGVRLTASAFVY